MSDARPPDNPLDQRRVGTPSPDSTESDDDDWDLEEELEAEQFGRVLDMSNGLAVRALLNHMHVSLMNGDLDKTETLIRKSYHFLDQVENKSIGVRIDEVCQLVEQHRREDEDQQQQQMTQGGGGWPETQVYSRPNHVHGRHVVDDDDIDAYANPNPNPESAPDALFKYLADDIQKPARPVVLMTPGAKPQSPLHINPDGIDDYYRCYHQDVPYSANVKACCCMPEEECYSLPLATSLTHV